MSKSLQTKRNQFWRKFQAQKWTMIREDNSKAILYCVYRYAEETGRSEFKLDDLYYGADEDCAALVPGQLFDFYTSHEFGCMLNGVSVNYSEFLSTCSTLDMDSIRINPDKTAQDVLDFFFDQYKDEYKKALKEARRAKAEKAKEAESDESVESIENVEPVELVETQNVEVVEATPVEVVEVVEASETQNAENVEVLDVETMPTENVEVVETQNVEDVETTPAENAIVETQNAESVETEIAESVEATPVESVETEIAIVETQNAQLVKRSELVESVETVESPPACGLKCFAARKLREAAEIIEAVNTQDILTGAKQQAREVIDCVKSAVITGTNHYLATHDGAALVVKTARSLGGALAIVGKYAIRATAESLKDGYSYVKSHHAPARHPFAIALGL